MVDVTIEFYSLLPMGLKTALAGCVSYLDGGSTPALGFVFDLSQRWFQRHGALMSGTAFCKLSDFLAQDLHTCSAKARL